MARKKTTGKDSYGAGSIQVLKGLEAVRKRPAMYIGGTSLKGLHHLVWEVLDNSVDEAMAGYCDKIHVSLHDDGSVSVTDNGRGIPVDIHPQEKKSGLELALTVLHAGGKFDKDSYKVSGGLHGVGVSVVNALSEWLEATVEREGRVYTMKFETGIPVTELKEGRKSKTTGTTIRFKPDAEIFDTVELRWETLLNRLRQVAYLNAGLKIILEDKRADHEKKEEFLFKKGLSEMVEYYNKDKEPLHKDVIHIKGESEGVEADIAIQYNSRYDENLLSFVNNVQTSGGGTHETGFKTALTLAVNGWISENMSKEKVDVIGSDLREGLLAVVSVRVPEPQFEGQTKEKLNNSEVRGVVQAIMLEQIRDYFDRNPKTIKTIAQKVVSAAKGRVAARKARSLVRKEKSLLGDSVLPGKLADCSSNDPSKNEIYIVEGDSAGGTAKQGRDRSFQAILPLRGKILNVEKATVGKILDNKEVKSIITALGTGFLGDFEVEKLRYDKVIIMTDADVDGAHIRTLILTLLFRHFRDLIDMGHVYVAQPPLYQLKIGKKTEYVYTEAERDKFMKKHKKTGASIKLQRYKGLGEMNADQLWETTMDPANRILLQVTLEDAMEADLVFTTLMGDEVAPRREWIMDNAKFVQNLDL